MFCENAFDRCWRMSNVGCWYNVFYDFGVLEGPTGSIFCILYLFYKCFAKIDVRVCGGLPVFEFCLFYVVFLMISVNVTVHWFYMVFVDVLWKCIWPLLADVECLCLVYCYCCLMIAWSWNGQTEAYCVFYNCFIYVSRKLMWEFVDGFQCSKICYFMVCFWWFRICFFFYWFCICFVAGSGRWPGGHRAGTGPGPVLSDIHRPPKNTLSKNPISRAEL